MVKPKLEAPESSAVDPFKDSHDHVLAELRRVSALLTLRANAHLAVSSANTRKLVGAHLDEKDILQLMEAATNPESAFEAEQFPPETLKRRFQDAKADAENTQKMRQASRQAGLVLRLDLLCLTCGLSPIEQDVVLLLLLAELDPNSSLLFAYLNDDLTRRFPTVHGLSGTLARNYRELTELVRLFAPQSPLSITGVIRIHDEGSPLADSRVRLSPAVVHYLLEMPGLPASLDSAAEYLPSLAMEAVQLESQDELSLRLLCTQFLKGFQEARRAGRPGVNLVLSLDGMSSNDYKHISQAIAHQVGVPLLSVGLPDLMLASEPEQLLRESLLFVRLTGSVLFLENLKSAKGARAGFLRELLSQLQRAVGLIVTDGNLQAISSCSGISLLTLHLRPRTRDSRLRLWQQAIKGTVLTDDVDLSVLSNAFRLDVQQIQAAVEWARGSVLLKEKGELCIDHSALQEGCRQQSDHSLADHGSKIIVRRKWDDLIVPREQIEQLNEMCLRIKHDHTVYEDWGLGARVSFDRGVNALFAGPSGTGKTMAAEIVAGELGLDAYRIDLSALINKYVGETEKNLSKVFDAAERSNAVLFFDEADALFGKRSAVKDSHDRYANIQVAYLLQRMEDFRGIAILATNLKANADEAFLRRLDFLIEFPFPETEERKRIWQKFLSGSIPVENIDIERMADKFRITGGVIKNAVVHAAFLAAEEGGPVLVRHIYQGVRREYQKMGRLTNEIDGLKTTFSVHQESPSDGKTEVA